MVVVPPIDGSGACLKIVEARRARRTLSVAALAKQTDLVPAGDDDHDEHQEHDREHEQEHEEVAEDDGEEDDEEVPELPFEITVGVVSMIHQDWWDEHPDALLEAEQVAEWLDFRVERRAVGPVIEQPVHRLTVTVEEAAQVLGISRATAYEAVGLGEIPCIRIGRRILIPRMALDRLLEGVDGEATQP